MQAVYFWRPDFVDNIFLALLPVGLIGLILAIRQRNQGVILWVILAAVFTFMAIASVGVGRYQLPIHPIIAVLVAVPLVMLWQFVRTRAALRRQSVEDLRKLS